MTGVDADGFLDRVRAQATADPLAARLTMAALVDRLLDEHEVSLIVVGGTAVDTYVSGGFGTSEALPAAWQESRDIDVIAVRATGYGLDDPARRTLRTAGFEVADTGGGLHAPGSPFAVDVVSGRLDEDISEEHLVTVSLDDWEQLDVDPVRLVGPEDLLFDYLESGVDTKHQRDWARALAIAQVMAEHLDLGYLFTKAHWWREGAYVDALERLLRGEPLEVDA